MKKMFHVICHKFTELAACGELGRTKLNVFLFLLLAFLAVPSAWAAYNDYYISNNGEVVTIPCTSESAIYVLDSASGVKTFYLYDDGGANGNHSNNCNGVRVITAPKGYGIKVWGWLQAESADYLYLKNGRNNTRDIGKFYGSGTTTQQKIGPYYSTSEEMTVSFITNSSVVGPGFLLYVEFVPLCKVFRDENKIWLYDIVGWIDESASPTYSEGMTVSFDINGNYNENRMWGLKVSKKDGTGVVEFKKNANTGKYEFVMPSSDVSIMVKEELDSAGFNLFNEEKSIYLYGSRTIKVYDEGGPEDAYASNFDGWLKLSTRSGFYLKVTGTVETEPSLFGDYDYLELYDGEVSKGTSAAPKCKVYTPKGSSVTKVEVPSDCVNFSEYMTIHFHANENTVASGLDLTVSSVGKIYSVKVFNTDPNGSISGDVTSAGTDSKVTLTAKPNSGYVLKSVRVVNKATGYGVATYGDWQTNKVTFFMPDADVEVTPTFVKDTYSITKDTAMGGSLNVASTAKVGTNVSVTANPASGYVLKDLVVKTASGNTINVDKKNFTTLSFTMPMIDVTVTPIWTNENLTAEGGLYINMPKTGTVKQTIPEGVTSFKVYDDGGKYGDYSNNSSGALVLTAPSGYVLRLSGNVKLYSILSLNYAYLTVCDGADTSNTKLVDKLGGSSSVGYVYSSGRNMTLYFHSDDSAHESGLDLTVTLIPIVNQIAYENTNSGGSVTSSAPTTANIGATVNYTYSYTSGYLVRDINVVGEYGRAVKSNGGWYSNKNASFLMPPGNVTVKSTYTNDWSVEGGLYINMPTTGTVNATIPEGVKSFKIYDDGGKSGDYSKGSNGTLVLTAPTGYFLLMTGTIKTGYIDHSGSKTCNANDYLNVYNGSSTAATVLRSNIVGCRSSFVLLDTSIVAASRSNTMTLNFRSDENGSSLDGLDLTVELRKPTSELADNGNGGKYVNMVVNHKTTLTIPAAVKSFKVYDNGGKDGDYLKGVSDTLVLTAPTGYVFEVGGSIKTGYEGQMFSYPHDYVCNANDNLSVYDGASPSATALLLNKTSDCSASSGPSSTSVKAIVSSGNTMTLVFKSNGVGNASSGLDLTVKLHKLAMDFADDGHGNKYVNMIPKRKATLTIPVDVPTFKVYDDGGESANYSGNNSDTLVLKAPAGYALQISGSVSTDTEDTLFVYSGEGVNANSRLGAYMNVVSISGKVLSSANSMTLLFKSDGTYSYSGLDLTVKLVKLEVTLKNDGTSNYVDMFYQHKMTFDIPVTLDSFKVYDDGGESASYSGNNSDTLVLKAPAGYALQISGRVSTDEQDTLFVYSGEGVDANSRLGAYMNFVSISGKVLSRANSMTLLFKSDRDYRSSGLDLTVKLVKLEVTLKNDGKSNYVDMLYQHKMTFYIPDTLKSFMVYDDGGKSADYSGNNSDTLVLVAPAGYVLQLSGSVSTQTDDTLFVYNGPGVYASFLPRTYTKYVSISDNFLSSTNSMTLLFKSDRDYRSSGLDLTVTLVPLDYDILVYGAENGMVVASQTTKLHVKDTVSLTAVPSSGYMLRDFFAADLSNNTVRVSQYSFSVSEFTMPAGKVTVSPTFTNDLTAAGGLHLDMRKNKKVNVNVPSNVKSFKVYDNGGKDGTYEANSDDTLTLVAPEGYRMMLTGSVIMENGYEYLYAYDGNNTQAPILLSATGSATSSNATSSTNIASITSSGRYMTLCFKSNGVRNYAGLDLTVTLQRVYKIVVNPASGGELSGTKSDTLGAVINLTASGTGSNHLSGVKVLDGNNHLVKSSIHSFDQAKFTLPASDVVVTPTFTSDLTAEGGLHLDMLKKGNETVYIPAMVKSFKLYDNGGKDSVYENYSNDTLTLVAPTGCRLKVTGSISAESGHDSLFIFDGSSTSGGKLFGRSGANSNFAYDIGSVTSTGRSLTFYFKSDYSAQRAGLDLKVSVENANYNITVEDAPNGQMFYGSSFAAENSLVKMGWEASTGYLLKDLLVVDAAGNRIPVDGGWYKGPVAFFTMPASDVTITPVFTNNLTAKELYIDMPWGAKVTAEIPREVRSFGIYDNGGKNGDYSEKSADTLMLVAPEGANIGLHGKMALNLGDSLIVLGGTSNRMKELFVGLALRPDAEMRDIRNLKTTGNYMMIIFKASGGRTNKGFDLVASVLKPINFLTIADIPQQSYTGDSIKPALTIMDGDVQLVEGRDYKLRYMDNVNSGTATVGIIGMGNYIGDSTATFTIGPKVTQFAAIKLLEDQRGMGVAVDGNYNGDEAIMITDSIEVDYVDYSRKFSTSGFSTVVLPFDVSTSNVSGLKKVAAFSEIKTNDAGRLVAVMSLVWKDSVGVPDTTLKANTPYMVLMNGTNFAVDGGVTLVPTVEPVVRSGTWEFRGTLAKRVWAEGDADLGHVYGFSAEERPEQNIKIGQFVKAGAGAWIRPGRAYLINVPETQQNHVGAGRPAIAALPSVFLPEDMDVIIEDKEDGSTTFIGRFNARTGEFVNMKMRTYDLKGRNVNGSKAKGMFIRK